LVETWPPTTTLLVLFYQVQNLIGTYSLLSRTSVWEDNNFFLYCIIARRILQFRQSIWYTESFNFQMKSFLCSFLSNWSLQLYLNVRNKLENDWI
jgi:hypothetical protein